MHEALFSIARALNIQRPLFFFDLETTGVNLDEDRIVSIAWARVEPTDDPRTGRSVTTGVSLVNPMRPIPKEASDVHGITDADVVTAPTFGQLATTLAHKVGGAVLIAFNGKKFDRRLLANEFRRAGGHVFVALADAILQAPLIDPCVIFHKKEARDLTAALKFYCDRELGDDAHGAEADTAACVEVLAAQLVSYPDLPRTVEALHDYCEDRKPEWIDREGKLAWKDGQPCINFGKYAGVSLQRLVGTDQGFLQWVLSKDFPADTKQIISDALRRKFPTPPAGKVA
jgi:DNA polymerase III subunit epsilon